MRGQQIPPTEPEAFTNTELVEMVGAVLTEGTPDEFEAPAGVTPVFRFDPLVWS